MSSIISVLWLLLQLSSTFSLQLIFAPSDETAYKFMLEYFLAFGLE